jgi:hypothetical protein
MLNGTLCATERTMCCILENYQEKNGIRVPAPLVPYMGGLTFLPFVKEVRSGESRIEMRLCPDATHYYPWHCMNCDSAPIPNRLTRKGRCLPQSLRIGVHFRRGHRGRSLLRPCMHRVSYLRRPAPGPLHTLGAHLAPCIIRDRQ